MGKNKLRISNFFDLLRVKIERIFNWVVIGFEVLRRIKLIDTYNLCNQYQSMINPNQ